MERHKLELGFGTLLLEYAARFGVVADQTEAYYSDLASRLRREVAYQGGLILVVASHKSDLGRWTLLFVSALVRSRPSEGL